jgi:hypothetical protein
VWIRKQEEPSRRPRERGKARERAVQYKVAVALVAVQVEGNTHYKPYECLVEVAGRMRCMLNAWWPEAEHMVNTQTGALVALAFVGHGSCTKTASLAASGRRASNRHDLYSEEDLKLSSLRI